MNKLTCEISQKAIEYGGIPFWSWNDKLNPDELRRQIRNMNDVEMRGFFMHARGGLETEYLSDEWYECIKACVDEAKKLGMEAWAYDENGWPSGFAGGKLLEDEDNHSQYINGSFSEAFPQITDSTVAVYAIFADTTPAAVSSPVDGCKKYLRIDAASDGSYVDTMRADVIAKFIEVTHEDYKRRLGDDFGKAMPGFFTDEPQYYRWATPYSKKMDEWFISEYGYSVIEALPALFTDYPLAQKHRYDFHRLAHIKFTENYSKQIYDWAEANGAQITGHFIEEQTLEGQMRCCGGIMPQYQYEHIPGIDYLGRKLQTDIPAKQLGSVCAQTGRKRVLSEMFACCGWDVSPRELKHIAELQYSGGVNVMCHHLYPYSIRGQRKRDYPAFYSEHSPWQKHLAAFNHYFNNLGYILSMGEEYADILVIHPMHTAWLHYRRNSRDLQIFDQKLAALTYLLSGNQIPYHFGDEIMMKTLASVDGCTLTLGQCKYSKIIVPYCDTLDSTTVALLKSFISNGGKVYTFEHYLPTKIDGEPADLSFLSGCEDISDSDTFEALRLSGEVSITLTDNVEKEDLRMVVRRTEYGRLIYLTNLSDKEFRSLKVSVSDCKKLGKLDISTLEYAALPGRVTENGAEAWITLNGSEAIVLTEYEAPDFEPFEPASAPKTITFTEPFKVDKLPENMMTLDRAYFSEDGINFTEIRPIERIRDNLLASRYRGNITLAFPFWIVDIPNSLKVVTEPMNTGVLKVNGVEIQIGTESAIDPSFRLTDISSALRVGENIIEVTIDYFQRDYVYYVLYGGVSETLRNCLVFDTEIECMYLLGDFAIDTAPESFRSEDNSALRYVSSSFPALIKQKATIDARNIVTDGYPFFAGEISFTTRLSFKSGDPTVLALDGRFATASVSVNGCAAGTLLFTKYLDLSAFLKEGENSITVTICNSYRNLLGPHHCKTAEPLSVAPPSFSFENKWNNGECKDFDYNYAFVRFGFDV